MAVNKAKLFSKNRPKILNLSRCVSKINREG